MSTGNIHQDRVIDLLKQVAPMGPIGAVMLQTIKEVLPQNEKIVCCYYQLDFSEDSGTPTFYSSIVQMLTSHHWIDLGFFPKYHSQRVLAVASVRDIRLENTFITGFEPEEAASGEGTGFAPVQAKLSAELVDPQGHRLETWVIEASRQDQMANLQEVARTLARVVGKSLTEALVG